MLKNVSVSCVCVYVSSGPFLSRIVTESIYLRRLKLYGQHHKMTYSYFSLRKLMYHVDTVEP
jgi:hypothetical protein